MSPSRKGREDNIERAYDLVVQRMDEGIHQSELWKELGISSREGSRLVREMEVKGLVQREKILHNGRWTYKLLVKMKPLEIGLIEDIFCFNCEYEHKCTALSPNFLRTCEYIEEWGLRKYRSFLESMEEDAGKEQGMAEGEEEGALLSQVEEGGVQEQGDLQDQTDR